MKIGFLKFVRKKKRGEVSELTTIAIISVSGGLVLSAAMIERKLIQKDHELAAIVLNRLLLSGLVITSLGGIGYLFYKLGGGLFW